MKKWVTVERAIAVISFLMSVGVIGWVQGFWQGTVEQAVRNTLVYKDKSGKELPTEFTKYHIISPTVQESTVKIKEVLEDKATLESFVEVFVGFKGMEAKELREYVEDKFGFAEEVQAMLDSSGLTIEDLGANHAYAKSNRERDSKYIKCGYILQDKTTKEPKLFVDCFGEPKKIYFGRPIGRNLEKDVYYYFNENGHPVILSYISNVVVNGN
jgi:hypothetical protein